MTDKIASQIVLPEQLVSPVDLSRIIRELKTLDESLRQAELRKAGQPTKLSRSSITLEDLARANSILLHDKNQRSKLIDSLETFQLHAPRIHMSLATEPSAVFLKRVIAWLRQNIHPLTLLEIGLQPTLAAGCMVRTNNKMFDLSLRHGFTQNRNILIEKINEVANKIEENVPAPKPVAATQPAAAASNPPATPAPPKGSVKSSPVQPPPPVVFKPPADTQKQEASK